MDKIPQKFIFNETFNYVELLYLNVETNKDLEIQIKNPDKATFTIIILFNNENWSENTYNISSGKIFTIKKDYWKNICSDYKIVCGVSFKVSFESKGIDTFYIIVNAPNFPGKDSDDDDKKRNKGNNSDGKNFIKMIA